MPTFLVEAFGASIISFVVERIIRKALTYNNNVNNINIDYQAQATEDELVIVADTRANKLFKFSNYI
jgi:hypothetical protein